MGLQELFRRDAVRYSIGIVLGVFLLAAVGSLVAIFREGLWLTEGAVAGLLFLGISFCLQGIVAFLGCAVIWRFGRSRVQWSTLDYTAPVIPLAIWALLISFGRGPRRVSATCYWRGS